MLSDVVLKAAVSEGRIKLSYKFWRQPNKRAWLPETTEFVHLSDRARDLFEEQITRSRVGLHLGCLIQPLSTTRTIRRRHRFESLKGVVDLRECGEDGWQLSPGSSAVAFTNEWLELPHDVEGLVSSRVGDYNTGLVIAGSYIDSTWRGLTKLHLTNHSRRAVRLHTGLELARLFLFETDGASADDHRVTRDAGHYDKTWDDILENGHDPFPQPSSPTSRFSAARLRNVNEFIKQYSGVPLVGAIVIAGSALYRAGSGVATADRLDAKAVALERELEGMRDREPRSGLVTVMIPAGETSGETDVQLERIDLRGAETFIDARATDGRSAGVSARVIFSPQKVLRVRVEDPAPTAAPREYEIRYLLVP